MQSKDKFNIRTEKLNLKNVADFNILSYTYFDQ